MQRITAVVLTLAQTQSGQLQNIQINHRRLGTAKRFQATLPPYTTHFTTRIAAIAAALGLGAVVALVSGGAAAPAFTTVIAFVSGEVALRKAAFDGTVAEMTAGSQDLTADGSTTVTFVSAKAGPSEFLVDVDSLPGGIEELFGLLRWNAGVASFTSRWIEDTFRGVDALLEAGQVQAGSGWGS